MIPVISLNKEVDSKLNLYERFIKVYGAVNNIPLGQGDSRLLAYYVVYGTTKETEDMMFDECRYASKQSIFNIKKSLVAKNLITRNSINKSLITVDAKLVHNITEAVSVKVNLYTREFAKQTRDNSNGSS